MQGCNSNKMLVVFRLGEKRLAIDINRVRDVISTLNVYQDGAGEISVNTSIKFHGRQMPLIILREKLGMRPVIPDLNSRIIIVENNGHSYGMIVDCVDNVKLIGDNGAETLQHYTDKRLGKELAEDLYLYS